MFVGLKDVVCFLHIPSTALFLFYADDRTNKTSFQYTRRLPGDKILIGRVKAIADGAMRLTTNKANDSRKYCLWSKQSCALSFEVFYLFFIH